MIHESPYDQREQEARDEDRRQALQDAGEEEMNERRQFETAYWAALGELEAGYPGDQDEEMTVGIDCCPHFVPYGSDCDECDEDEADCNMGLSVPRSPPDDLTSNETRGE